MDSEVVEAIRRTRLWFLNHKNNRGEPNVEDLILVAEHFVDKAMDPISQLVCEHLPEGWNIEIELEHGAGCMKLFDPDGKEVDLFPDDEGSFVEFARDRVNYARHSDGLDPVTIDGEWSSEIPKVMEPSDEDMRAVEEDSYLDPNVPVFEDEEFPNG